MPYTVELHVDDDPASRGRLADCLLIASAHARARADDQPLRSQCSRTTRHDWAVLAADLAVAAKRTRHR